jgi:hypothetical protein
MKIKHKITGEIRIIKDIKLFEESDFLKENFEEVKTYKIEQEDLEEHLKNLENEEVEQKEEIKKEKKKRVKKSK